MYNIYTVEPAKLNTCVHWTIFHVLADFHWKSMGVYVDTLNIEKQIVWSSLQLKNYDISI